MSFAIWICAEYINGLRRTREEEEAGTDDRDRTEKTELKITKKMNFWDFAAKRSERIIMRMMIS